MGDAMAKADGARQIESVVTITLNTAIDRVLEVERFAIGAHMAAKELTRYPAGKGVNVSRALARLGRDSVVTGFVGHEQAALFERTLGKAGPGRAVCQLLAARGATRENITVLDREANTDTHLRTTGYELGDRDVDRILSKLGLLARQEALLVFCGSLPGGMDEMDFNALVHLGISSGAEVVLDLHGVLLRHLLGLQEAEIDLEQLPAAAARKAFAVLNLTRSQLAQTFYAGREVSDAVVIRTADWLSRVAETVLIALPGHRALLIDETGDRWLGGVRVEGGEIKSTVGSGDSLLAGFLDAQLRGQGGEQALRYAMATATANSQAVAMAAFDAAQVSDWLDRTWVEALPGETLAGEAGGERDA